MRVCGLAFVFCGVSARVSVRCVLRSSVCACVVCCVVCGVFVVLRGVRRRVCVCVCYLCVCAAPCVVCRGICVVLCLGVCVWVRCPCVSLCMCACVCVYSACVVLDIVERSHTRARKPNMLPERRQPVTGIKWTWTRNVHAGRHFLSANQTLRDGVPSMKPAPQVSSFFVSSHPLRHTCHSGGRVH